MKITRRGFLNMALQLAAFVPAARALASTDIAPTSTGRLVVEHEIELPSLAEAFKQAPRSIRIPTHITAALTFLLFFGFFILESILLVTKRAGTCGCYGLAYARNIDGASVAASAILTCFAAFHLWATIVVLPVDLRWRLPLAAVFGCASIWLVSKVAARNRLRARLRDTTPSPMQQVARDVRF